MDIKIIFIGTPEFGAIVLNKLVAAKLTPVLVITATDKPVGREQTITPPPVKSLAQKYNIKTVQSEKIGEAKADIQKIQPDLIVTASFGQILPKDILDIPKHGSLNVHPSLLPKWRGPSPIQFTIMAGDKTTGATIIKMTEKVDAGPIISKQEITLRGDETYLVLHNRLAELGGELIAKTIHKWIEGEITAKEQDESNVIYTKIIKKEDGQIDWQKPPIYIERQIKALNPWPGTYTTYQGKRLKILKAKTEGDKLKIEEVHLEGKVPTSFKDFLLGHPDYVIPQ